MARCVAVIGASHVGKSTLVDRLAQVAAEAAAPKPSADLRIAAFDYLGDAWTAIDAPGSIELMQESVDALLAADAVVVVVSPDPEQAALAAPYLRAVEAAGVPSVVFVNRMDEAQARLRDIVSALQDYARHPLVLRQVPIREDGAVVGAVDLISERAWRYREGRPSALIEIPEGVLDREQEARAGLLEDLSAFDDWLLEEIVEDREPADGPLYALCGRVLASNQAIPVLIGSASHGNGVVRLMKALRHEAPAPEATRARLAAMAGLDDPTTLKAAAFRAEWRRHVGKTVALRVFDDGVKAGAALGGAGIGVVAAPASEKLTPLEAAGVGDLVIAAKSDHLALGALYGADAAFPAPSWRRPLAPQMSRVLAPIEERDDAKLSEALAKLAEVDAALTLGHDPETGAHVVHCQGALHLRRLRQALAESFGVETRDGPISGGYRETITRSVDAHYRHKKQSGGAGQFADVKLTIAPNERGDGFAFDEVVKGGAVPRNYIPAVETGAEEAMKTGPLGFPVVDVSVTLTDGQHHSVDSSDMAFRIAGRQGVSAALGDATPVLLEPIYSVRFSIPSAFAGALVQVVSTQRGHVLGFDRDETAAGWDVFRAEMPGAALEELCRDVRATTQGVGRFDAELHRYQELYGKEAETVIAARSQAG